MDCSLQQCNDPLQRKEMHYMRETDSFRAGHCSYLPLEGLGKVKSTLPILCRHIENTHFQQDRERSVLPTSFFERGLAPLSNSTLTSSSNPFRAAS